MNRADVNRHCIDLNCDMGEIPEAIESGAQAALMPFISSVNIACGGHAGDEQSMTTTILQARQFGLAIGAHPSYPDRAGFGRMELDLTPSEIAETVHHQCEALARVAEKLGVRIAHVKPHGALYNHAARDAVTAQAIADGIARWDSSVILVGLAVSIMLEVFRKAGFRAVAEGFADRRYEPDGSLASRKRPDALIEDPEAAAAQALELAQGKTFPYKIETICLHSDTPGAERIAAAVATALRGAGIEIKPLGASYPV